MLWLLYTYQEGGGLESGYGERMTSLKVLTKTEKPKHLRGFAHVYATHSCDVSAKGCGNA